VVSRATKQAIIKAALAVAPKTRQQLAAAMVQPVQRRIFPKFGNNKLVHAIEKGWLCTKCWISSTIGGMGMEHCKSCEGELDRQDIPSGCLWVYDDEILAHKTIL
jgi:hypothetical protein